MGRKIRDSFKTIGRFKCASMMLGTCALLLASAGCGSESSAPVASSDEPSNDQAAPKAEPTDQTTPMGQWGTSGTLTARVVSTRTASTLTYIAGTQSDETPDGEAVTKKAGADAKYVFVRANIKNNGKAGIDLTCGGLVQPKLLDADQNEYSVVTGISQLAKNPECNVNLDPGFKDAITWAYRLPSDAKPFALKFVDATDYEEQPDPVLLSLSEKASAAKTY